MGPIAGLSANSITKHIIFWDLGPVTRLSVTNITEHKLRTFSETDVR
jgi:hypothetical protein